ncbi:MAG: hypothetical protein H6772_04550 [Pseudomonadales bacterium]|nr:hypothetical protein [Pseudomonadales bacterium]
MNIYFTASARAPKEIKLNYKIIHNLISNLEHKNTDNYEINTDPNKFYSSSDNHKTEVHNNALKLIKKSEVVILEVSTHSLTMGYLIKYALDLRIPVIALYINKHEPGFILGIEDDNFQLIEYEPKNLKKILNDSISFANNQGKSRFNLMLSPKLSSHIQEYSKKEGISKASFIRKLISQNMDKNNQKNLY